MHHAREVGADVAMRLAPDGLVVDEVHEVVSIAVEGSIDRCLIKQTRVADLWVVRLLEDVLAGRALNDVQDVPNLIDVHGCAAAGRLSSNS